MTDPTTPATGATNEQIEAAAQRYIERWGGSPAINEIEAREWSECLVLPEYRIVRADVDVRERAIESAMTRLGEPHPTATITETVDATLAALLEDGR